MGKSMHAYGIDSKERQYATVIMAMFSILLAWAYPRAFDFIDVKVPWWVDAPSVFGIYGILSVIFDKWAWRWGFLRKTWLVKVPDLNGIWRGAITSSFDGHTKTVVAEMKIIQRWTRIAISFKTDQSKSHSVMAGIVMSENGETSICYEYMNEPLAGACYTMHIHRGMARLYFCNDRGEFTLSGEYFTGRGRQNYGAVNLKRSTYLPE